MASTLRAEYLIGRSFKVGFCADDLQLIDVFSVYIHCDFHFVVLFLPVAVLMLVFVRRPQK